MSLLLMFLKLSLWILNNQITKHSRNKLEWGLFTCIVFFPFWGHVLLNLVLLPILCIKLSPNFYLILTQASNSSHLVYMLIYLISFSCYVSFSNINLKKNINSFKCSSSICMSGIKCYNRRCIFSLKSHKANSPNLNLLVILLAFLRSIWDCVLSYLTSHVSSIF